MAETGAQKRKAEDETTALASDTLGDAAQPAAKKVKTEPDSAPTTSAPAATDAGTASTINDVHVAAQNIKQEGQAGDKSEATNGSAENTSEVKPESEPSQTLGYKTFKNGDETFKYFHDLIHDLRHDQDLNEVRAASCTQPLHELSL